MHQSIIYETRKVTEREKRLHRFMDSAQDLIIAFDNNNCIHYINKAIRKRLGLSDESAAQLKILDVLVSVMCQQFSGHKITQFSSMLQTSAEPHSH